MEINKFDALQTFYVDATSVNNSSEIYLTSIEVYFKNKPASANSSSIYNPGVTLSICEVENDIPVLTKVYDDSLCRIEYDNIYSFSDASAPSTFVFKKPLLLKTNKFYGFIIQFDDLGFELWSNKQGDKIIGTNIPSPGINSAKDGKYFNAAVNSTNLKPLTNIDLKYKINIAKFTANTLTVELVNKDYEFLTINNVSGSFVGGEYVFKKSANAQGNIAITLGNTTVLGTNTLFDQLHSGDKITVLGTNAESNGIVFTVSSVISNTELELTTTPLFSNTSTKYISDVVGKVFRYDNVKNKLFLYTSTSNTTNYLAANDILLGSYSHASATIESVDNFKVDRIAPLIKISSPSIGTYNGTYNFSYSNGTTYLVTSSNEKNININDINEVSKYDGYVLSRSNEVNDSNLYDNNARKSAITKIAFNVLSSSDRLFTAPSIDEDEIDFFIHQSNISNTTDVISGGVSYDTEVSKNGTGLSKHISKKVTFANNRFAEDIRVFADIYRPANTDVKIYCKLHNSADPEAFDDKSWTPLELIENKDRYSSSENKYDYIEYSFGLPKYPETANNIPGTVKTDSGNSIVIGSGMVVNNYIQAGDVVRIFNPLEANTDYFVSGVVSSNTTALVLNTTTSNASVLGSGLKIDKVKYKNIAFNDPQNDNISSYFNNGLSYVSKFDTMQFKIVFIADNTYYIPRVNSISVVGVSA